MGTLITGINAVTGQRIVPVGPGAPRQPYGGPASRFADVRPFAPQALLAQEEDAVNQPAVVPGRPASPQAAGAYEPGGVSRLLQELGAQRVVVEQATRAVSQASGEARQNVISRTIEAEAVQQASTVNALAALDFERAFPAISERTNMQTVINRPPTPGRDEPPVVAVSAPGPMLRRMASAAQPVPRGESRAPSAVNVEAAARMVARLMVEASAPVPEPAGRQFHRVA